MPNQLYTMWCKFLDQSYSSNLKPKFETVKNRRFHWTRGLRFFFWLGNDSVTWWPLVQVKVVVALCFGCNQLLAPAAYRRNILCICGVFFFPVFIVFFASYLAFNTFAFFLLRFCRLLCCCFRRFSLSFPPFPPFCLLFKPCIYNTLLFFFCLCFFRWMFGFYSHN